MEFRISLSGDDEITGIICEDGGVYSFIGFDYRGEPCWISTMLAFPYKDEGEPIALEELIERLTKQKRMGPCPTEEILDFLLKRVL